MRRYAYQGLAGDVTFGRRNSVDARPSGVHKTNSEQWQRPGATAAVAAAAAKRAAAKLAAAMRQMPSPPLACRPANFANRARQGE